MTSLVGASLFALATILLFVRRRFLFYLLFLLLVSFAMRLASALYIDLAGPVYSVQLFREMGPGTATLPLSAAHLLYLLIFIIIFGPAFRRRFLARARQLHTGGRSVVDQSVADIVFAAYVCFLVLLFLDFWRIGVVPFVVGMERFEYTEQYGGVWHQVLMKYGVLLALPLGVFFSYGALFRGRPDLRFLFVLLGLYVYVYLAGHRFSAFYGYGAAFLMPYAAAAAGRRVGGAPSDPRRIRRVWTLAVPALTLCLGATLVGTALYRSYYVNRELATDPGDTRTSPFASIVHRVLVQPGELWFVTWERVFVEQRQRPNEAFDGVFINPVSDPARNTTIPYLMVAEIGDRAYPTLDAGSAYAGGYPEIFFELLGSLGAYLGIAALALITALLARLLLFAIVERRYVRIFLCWYVLFALVLVPLGGMLNFLVNVKFWLKVLALVAWMVFELERERARARRNSLSEVSA